MVAEVARDPSGETKTQPRIPETRARLHVTAESGKAVFPFAPSFSGGVAHLLERSSYRYGRPPATWFGASPGPC